SHASALDLANRDHPHPAESWTIRLDLCDITERRTASIRERPRARRPKTPGPHALQQPDRARPHAPGPSTRPGRRPHGPPQPGHQDRRRPPARPGGWQSPLAPTGLSESARFHATANREGGPRRDVAGPATRGGGRERALLDGQREKSDRQREEANGEGAPP